jgi:hypothetical protein
MGCKEWAVNQVDQRIEDELVDEGVIVDKQLDKTEVTLPNVEPSESWQELFTDSWKELLLVGYIIVRRRLNISVLVEGRRPEEKLEKLKEKLKEKLNGHKV